MSLISTKSRCRLCSKLSSKFKGLFRRPFRRGLNCSSVFQRAADKAKARVSEVASNSANCACEKFIVSRYSRCPVGDEEVLARFAFHPIHVAKKTGELKPSLFSQVGSDGCSIQRESKADTAELLSFVRSFLEPDGARVWLGVVSAQCASVRALLTGDSPVSQRAVCVYDTAEPHNPAHAELFQAVTMPEADAIELRRKLWGVFGSGVPTRPEDFRSGQIWSQLPEALKMRKVVSK